MNHVRTVPCLVAAVFLVSLTSCTHGPKVASSPTDASPAQVAGSTALATAGSDPVSGWVPLEGTGGGGGAELLEPGVYGLTANGLSGMPWAVLTVPRGFVNLDGWLLMNPPGTPVRGVGYWTVSAVDKDPCGVRPDFIDAGSTVEDLAAAFSAQKLTRTTEPVQITLDGHSGLYLELHVPSDIDFSECGDNLYQVWLSDPGGGRYMQEPGQIDRLWILDVDGETVVLHATAVPGEPRAQRQQQAAMVESVRFVARD